MKIVICGSMAFSPLMLEISKDLQKRGDTVTLPHSVEEYASDADLLQKTSGWGTVEGAERKIANDLIREHFQAIQEGDAVLIVNADKNGIKNYIGGNGFLEMGFAHVLNKPLYLLNPLPTELPLIHQELLAMQPIILHGDLAKLVV